MTREMVLRPVGTVRNKQKEMIWGPGGAGGGSWAEKAARSIQAQEAISEIEIASDLANILDGIEEFSHLWIIYWADRSPTPPHALQVHPMGREDWPLVGLFATRSPVRPNNLCLALVRLIERRGNALTVRGLDAVDGTPVVDIKPYTPGDAPAEEVKMPAWMHQMYHEFAEAAGEGRQPGGGEGTGHR